MLPRSLKSLIADHRGLPRLQTVAYCADGAISWGELLAASQVWRQRLTDISQSHILVQLSHGHELLAALLAIWQLGKVAVLSAAGSDGLARLCPGLEPGATLSGVDPADVGLTARDGDLALVLFTSGSSGAPVAVAKTFGQLDAELQLLETSWGSRVGDSVVVATVSRQHMYGLPFGLLWPLVRGSPFYSETLHYLSALEALCRRFPVTLVTSPVQLDNLPDNLDWAALAPRLALIFSAGAPLSEFAAVRCRQLLVPVTEIYGSTESGVVAWRDQTRDSRWQCLPGIRVAAAPDTGQLRIYSPCGDVPCGQAMTAADRAQVYADSRFALLGRSDRIAKVGGKRISLTEVDDGLLAHPWVEVVKTLVLEDRKSRVGAVVVLSAEGCSALVDRGRRWLNERLAEHLRSLLEPVAIPRYWRYPGRLPVNPQGKVDSGQLALLFAADRQPREPEVLERQLLHQGGGGRLVLRIPDTLYYFNGHFPGNPVLPGVVQVSWAEHYGRQLFGDTGRFVRLESVKFQHIIQAGEVVILNLTWEPARARLHFSYVSATARHASGRLVYEPNHE